jgi:alpha-ribazole phosphatase
MPNFYLVRHAQPEMAGRLLGQLDVPLSAAGRTAASRLVLPVNRIFCSPLRRAIETATLALANSTSRGAPSELIVIPEFREITYGQWDGLAPHEIPDGSCSPPDAEPWLHFLRRVAQGLEKALRVGLPLAVIAHAGVNAAIAHLLGLLDDPFSWRQGYCEIRSYDI